MNTPAALFQSSSPLSTLRYRPRLRSLVYAGLLGWMFIAAAAARFRLPQVPFVDGDFWGYLNPATSALTGHGFAHTYGRDTLYPGFIYVILRCFRDFRFISIAQHVLGLGTGVLMLLAYRQGLNLLRFPNKGLVGFSMLLGLLPVAIYLTSPSSIYYEHCVRPEAVFPFFAVLSIWLNLAFIHRRWIVPAPAGAAWLGAAQMVVSVIAYKLKPSFGFALLFANLPLLVSLPIRGMPRRNKLLMAGGGALFCALFLVLPESLLKKRDPIATLFLPDTLLTIHADLIRDQIASDVAAHQSSPFPPETVQALLDRLNTTLPLSRLPENRPYSTLGFNPDYLLYLDPVYNGVTRWTPEGWTKRAALGMYYYQRTFLHHPILMLGKIWRQMDLFYHFGTGDRSDLFTYDWRMIGARLTMQQQNYQRNVDLCQQKHVRKTLAVYPPLQTFEEASAPLAQHPFTIEQKPILTVAQKILELLYLPELLVALLLTLWTFAAGRLRRGWRLPLAVTLLLFSYNLGNTLTISVVHSLDIARYIENQLTFTLLSAMFGLLLIGGMVRRQVSALVAAPSPETIRHAWTDASAPVPSLYAPAPSNVSTPPSLCVLIPCYNEVSSIAAVVAEYRAVFPTARLLVVDNASTDGTADAAHEAGADVIFEPGQGKARAVLTALTHIESDLVLMVDGDGSYPAEGGRRLFESYLAQPADLVTGIRNRAESADGSFRPFHQGGTHLFGRIIGLVFGWHAADLFSGLRLFSRRFYENVPILSRGFELELELTVQAIDKGFEMRELPVPFGLRAEGTQSKLRTVQDGSRILRLLFVMFRDYRPLVCFSTVAGVFFLLSLLAGSAPIHDYVTTRFVTHLPLAVLAASLMILAFLCLQTGLVLESGLRHQREATQLRLRDHARRLRR